MNQTQNDFLFVAYQDPNFHLSRRKNPVKNRHAQLRASRNNACGNANLGHAIDPQPILLKFRAYDKRYGRNDAGLDICPGCKRRRPLLSASNRCMECDQSGKARQPPMENESSSNHVSASHKLPCPTKDVSEAALGCQISCGMRGCPANIRALHYFLHFAALDLSGYLPVHFWSQFILQVAYSEPIVRQTVVAVSNAHYDHCTSVTLSATSTSSYQVAVNKLRSYLETNKNPSRELVLLCCILFFTFERLREDVEAAGVHLRGAMSILTQAQKTRHGTYRWTPGKSCDGSDAVRDLTVLLMQMDIEDTIPALDRGPLLRIEDPANAVHWEAPPRFTFWTTHDFMETWMHVSHTAWEFIGRNAQYRHLSIEYVPDIVAKERKQLLIWIQAWRDAVKEWFRRNPLPDAELLQPANESLSRRLVEAINALTLELHYFSVKGLLIECLDDDQKPPEFDYFAEKMLWRGEKALCLRQAYRRMHGLCAKKTFSTHVGIPESLLYLCHRTRSASVRSRAQRLIRGFRAVSGELTGVTAFFAGCGAPPRDMVFIYELPGH